MRAWIYPLLLVVLAVGAGAFPAQAQVHLVLLDRPTLKPGEKVAITCVCGTPFVGERIDVEKPQKATAYPPLALLNQVSPVDLLRDLEKVTVTGAGNKTATGYRCTFEPKEAGDYILAFEFPPLWLEKEKQFVQDTVRVVVHVQKELGWAHNPTRSFAFVPMTRPYGLRVHTLFQARLIPHEKSAGPHLVQLEKFLPEPPTELPEEEFITLRFRTDDHGVASCTLPEKGWWVLSAEETPVPMTLLPKLKHGNSSYPVLRRALLLVFVAGLPEKGPK